MNRPDWLDRDVLSDMEKVIKKDHYSQFNELENSFAMTELFKHNLKVTDYYKQINDTYWGITWNEFINLIEGKGFKLVLLDDFICEGRHEKLGIWGWKEKGLLLVATTYSNSLNSGTMYGQAKRLPHFDKFFPISATCGYTGETVRFNIDVREGLFLNIETIEKDMELLKIWNDHNSFLWLLDYTQTKVDGYNYEEINRERLSRCPQWIKDMVRLKERLKTTK